MTISRYGGRWLTIPRVQSVNDVSRHQRLARLPVPGRPLPCLPPPGRLPRPPRSPLPPDPARCCRPRQVFRYGCCMGLEREGCGPGGCCGTLTCLPHSHRHSLVCMVAYMRTYGHMHAQTRVCMYCVLFTHRVTLVHNTCTYSVTFTHAHNTPTDAVLQSHTCIITYTHIQSYAHRHIHSHACKHTYIVTHTHTHAYPHTF